MSMLIPYIVKPIRSLECLNVRVILLRILVRGGPCTSPWWGRYLNTAPWCGVPPPMQPLENLRAFRKGPLNGSEMIKVLAIVMMTCIIYIVNNLIFYQLNLDLTFQDFKFFHSIVYNFSCVKLPDYLTLFSGSTRLRSTHLAQLCFVSSVQPRGTTATDSRRGFANTFFYRAYLLWNRLPFSLREVEYPGMFKRKLVDYIWTELVSNPEGNDTIRSEISDEEGVEPD